MMSGTKTKNTDSRICHRKRTLLRYSTPVIGQTCVHELNIWRMSEPSSCKELARVSRSAKDFFSGRKVLPISWAPTASTGKVEKPGVIAGGINEAEVPPQRYNPEIELLCVVTTGVDRR